MKYASLLFLSLTSCGLTVHSDPVRVDPIQVKGSLGVDFSQVMAYCANSCKIQTPNDPITIGTCTTDCYNNFLSILGAASK